MNNQYVLKRSKSTFLPSSVELKQTKTDESKNIKTIVIFFFLIINYFTNINIKEYYFLMNRPIIRLTTHNNSFHLENKNDS